MASLTKKQIRDAAPAGTLPFEVLRKYGKPALYGKAADVRNALKADVESLQETANRIGSPADRLRLSELESQVTGIGDHTEFPLSFDVLVDDYTGVRYQVTVRDRRM